jgi:hypothetical protein
VVFITGRISNSDDSFFPQLFHHNRAPQRAETVSITAILSTCRKVLKMVLSVSLILCPSRIGKM